VWEGIVKLTKKRNEVLSVFLGKNFEKKVLKKRKDFMPSGE
jgi:hypothetical protein